MARNRGADIVMSTLRQQGVDTVFTLSGNHIMPLFDAALDEGPNLVHTRHEAAAVHMADAYGRLTGRAGIAMVTGGPGHANASPALYTARCADSPLVLLSGHAPTNQLGQAAFQELRQADVAAPMAKASWMATSAEGLAADVEAAIRIATTGRPGPVHLSLPSDLLDAEVTKSGAASPAAQGVQDPAAATSSEWQQAGEWLAKAERPVMIAGPVFARANLKAGLMAVAQSIGIPCVIQESPRGLNDPSLGAFAEVLAEADVVVLAAKAMDFTVRFGAAPAWRPDAKVIAIDADPAQLALSRDRKGADAVLLRADAAAALAGLKQLEGRLGAVAPGWPGEVDAAVSFRPASWDGPQAAEAGRLHPLDMCRAIKPLVESDPNTVLIMDGGEIGQWAQAVLSAPRRITNSVSGSIGATLPFAIAARKVESQAPVIAIMGDGTVGFHLAEFETAVRSRTPFVVIVGNDARWNAEHQIQINHYGANRAQGCELLPAAYDQVCRAFGGFGASVSTPEQMATALAEAVASGLPSCINVMLDGRAAPTLRRAAS